MDPAAPSTLTDYLGVVRRRWWIALMVIALATGSALLVSRVETPKYQAAAEVRLSDQPLASILKQQGNTTTAERDAATQAQVAATVPIARLALKEAKVKDITPQELLSRSTITASATSDFLDFSVTDRSSVRAKLLATSYAHAYADWANKSGVALIDQTLKPLRLRHTSSPRRFARHGLSGRPGGAVSPGAGHDLGARVGASAAGQEHTGRPGRGLGHEGVAEGQHGTCCWAWGSGSSSAWP